RRGGRLIGRDEVERPGAPDIGDAARVLDDDLVAPRLDDIDVRVAARDDERVHRRPARVGRRRRATRAPGAPGGITRVSLPREGREEVVTLVGAEKPAAPSDRELIT